MALHRAVLMCVGLVSAMRKNGQLGDLEAEIFKPEFWAPGTYYYSFQSELFQEKMLKGRACYCKQVADISECPYWKEDKDSYQPDRMRWFHGNLAEGKKPHYCCKLEKNAWYNRVTKVGWGYQRQATAKLCMMEMRPVPEDVCCRLGNETIGLHVKQVTLEGYQQYNPVNISRFPYYGKSYPHFTMSDIRGATDYDGTPISAEKVREFLMNKVKSGVLENKLTCSKTIMEMNKDKEDCRLRSTGSSAECCCLQASVDPAVRCLPATGGSSLAEVVITGIYTESQSRDGIMEGMISWPNGSNPEDWRGRRDLEDTERDLVNVHSRDPMTNDQVTYDWTVAHQWDKECVKYQRFAYEEYQGHISPYYKPYYSSYYKTDYVQGLRKECISYKYTRLCPVGQGRYYKQIPSHIQGTCAVPAGKGLQLEKVGSLTMQCPEGYVSGTAGGMKFNQICSCTGC